MTERVLTPSKIAAWLDCGTYLHLKHQVESGLIPGPAVHTSSFAQLLMDKGLAHEQACLSEYKSRGLRVLRVEEKHRGESFARWAARVSGLLTDTDWDVLYQMPLMHDGVRGVADFIVRSDESSGDVAWEPVDSKLARKQAKPAHVLQLAFYSEALTAATGVQPKRMHLWLGSGRFETLKVRDFAAYWRRLRRRLAAIVDADLSAEPPVPQPCEHCAFCEFAQVCEQRWRGDDSLVYVAGLRGTDRAALEGAGVRTLATLADQNGSIPGLPDLRRERLVAQAGLQCEARSRGNQPPPPFRLIALGDDPVWGRGLCELPMPDDGDVFLDFEGHPFWRADRGLFFLMGLIERSDGEWAYRTWWAHDEDDERRVTADLIAYLAERRAQFPGMHVYHYNHTERSSLERLAAEHGAGEVALAQLVETGAFVDLLVVARNAVQVGTESYGLKALETLTGYVRGHDIDAGAGAVLSYEHWLATSDDAALTAIEAYNEDDVRATRAVRDWLVQQRPAELPWRVAVMDPDDDIPQLDELVERLHAFGPDTTEHLLGDVLGYWRREWKAYLAPRLAACVGEPDDLRDDPSVLTELEPVGLFERTAANGRALTPAMRFRFPLQECDEIDDKVLFQGSDGPPGYASVCGLDPEAGEIDLVWSDTLAERGVLPTVVAANTWISPNPKPAALNELANRVLADGEGAGGAAMALLRRDPPEFSGGGGPVGGLFTDDVADMAAWAPELDGSYVAVQGPPGTGKTYRGARQIKALLEAGKRVGITAFSHKAIDNLLRAVVDLFQDDRQSDQLRAVKRGGDVGAVAGADYAKGNAAAAKETYNLVAGTTWLFAGSDMAARPVDVLVVDEAGQLSLADTLAACRSALNLILLGDPLQLPQVSQAAHPGTSGDSVLEHVLGDASTMPAERGVFITETRRMHPDVCSFISENVYDGRLTSHPSCAVQLTIRGTGLRWLRADHIGRSTSAPEEAALVVAEARSLLGTDWLNQHGVTAAIRSDDIMVVAPYNDQVDLLREHLDADAITRGVPVGTVDKFQGQEAAVVFFSMATSSADLMPRNADFLFSRNRLNVAVSRARCLAYLVCTETLLDTRGRDVEEMRLLSTLSAFVEMVEGPVTAESSANIPHRGTAGA